MSRRSTTLAALLLLAPAVGCGGDGGSERPPHVLLITLDTVRADYLSCYGSSTQTPALDQIASEGVVFERAVAASGLTPTSHATILTGKFQYGHGLRVLSAESGFRLEEDQTGLATAFKEAGYVTGAVHSAFPVSGYFGFDRDFDEFQSFDTTLQLSSNGQKTGWNVEEFQRRSEDTTRRALEWFKKTAATDDRPVFLWLHYWDPHDPVILPPEEQMQKLMYDPATGRMKDEKARVYAAELRYQDTSLAGLFAGLASEGILDNTVLAITADHGQGLDDGTAIHGWGMHRALYREQLHVPLILRGPGVPKGVRAAEQVRTADVAPTLVQLAGLPADALDFDVEGESLVKRFDGGDHGHLVAYGEQVNGYDDNAGMRRKRPEAAFLNMVSDGDWKVIYRQHMPERSELFHVAVDPNETRDVRKDHPDEYLRLMADLAERNPWVLAPFPKAAKTSGGVGNALTSLGYAGAEQGSANWQWACPDHRGIVADERTRCEECQRIMVPVGEWKEPDAK